MQSRWISVGALLAAASVIAGAAGAHGVPLDEPARHAWETAARYLMYGGLGVMAAGLAASLRPGRGPSLAAACLGAGSLIFSGTLGGLALGGPHWLLTAAPFGGLLLIAGFLVLAFAGLRR